MSPGPAAKSGRDNLGSYLRPPFFTGGLADFLAYPMRPGGKKETPGRGGMHLPSAPSPGVHPHTPTRPEVPDRRPCQAHQGQCQGVCYDMLVASCRGGP